MSWSIKYIGKPDNVVKALEDQAAKFDGQTKVEYDDALPHLVGLVKQTFGQHAPVISIEASGHGYASEGQQVNRQLTCKVELHYGTIV